MATVWLTGASSSVGRCLLPKLNDSEFDVKILGRSATPDNLGCDLSDEEEVKRVVEVLSPSSNDVLILLAAISDPSLCVASIDACRINIISTQLLIEKFAGAGAFVIFFSSEYVYSSSPFLIDEDVTPSPTCSYGAQKLISEKYLQSVSEDMLIFRCAKMLDDSFVGEGHLARIFLGLAGSRPLVVAEDQIMCPILMPDVVESVLFAIRHKVRGVFNLGGQEVMSRLDLVQLIVGYRSSIGLDSAEIRLCRFGSLVLPDNIPRELRLNSNRWFAKSAQKPVLVSEYILSQS